jgi:hypothetical protein
MLALDESGLLQPLSQRGDRLRKADFRRAPEKTDHRHRRLLRARRERPRYRRAAEERDEIAAFHCPVPPVLPIEQETASLQDFDWAYDRSGSSSTELAEAARPFMSAAPPYRS